MRRHSDQRDNGDCHSGYREGVASACYAPAEVPAASTSRPVSGCVFGGRDATTWRVVKFPERPVVWMLRVLELTGVGCPGRSCRLLGVAATKTSDLRGDPRSHWVCDRGPILRFGHEWLPQWWRNRRSRRTKLLEAKCGSGGGPPPFVRSRERHRPRARDGRFRRRMNSPGRSLSVRRRGGEPIRVDPRVAARVRLGVRRRIVAFCRALVSPTWNIVSWVARV